MRIWSVLVQKSPSNFGIRKMLLTNWSFDPRAGVIAPLPQQFRNFCIHWFFFLILFLFLSDVAFGLVFLEMVFLDLSLSGEYPGRWSILTSLIQSWLFSLLEGGSEFSSYEIKLQNQVKQNDVILQFTNSAISKEILLLSY